MRSLLVTGGAGYIGSVMVPVLLEAGYRVRVLDNLRKGAAGLVPMSGHPSLEVMRGDVRDEATVRQAIADMDAIIHLAAIVGFPACQKDPWLAQQVNLEATRLLDQIRGTRVPLVFASSLSNYGAGARERCTEAMAPEPLTLYGRTKLAAEQLLLASGNTVVFRPATAFGLSPLMRLDLLLNDFVYRAVRDRRLVVYEPDYMRAFLHVGDFGRAFLFALEHLPAMRDQVFNLGDESLNVTKRELARRIQQHVACEVEYSETGRDPDQRNYVVDFSKLRSTGFRVARTLDDGIVEVGRAAPLLDVFNPYSNASF